jgi:RND family efflux transporter MFP subunit
MTMRRPIPAFRLIPLTLLGALAAACSAGDESAASGATPVVSGVRTALVEQQPFVQTIDASAIVSARPDGIAALSAPSPARVTAVHVVVGQRVAVGEALVDLDQVAFQAAANAAGAALASADTNLSRVQRLAASGIASRREVEQATAALAAARADAENARRQSELSIVRSPIAGIVTEVSAVLGATADPSQRLVQVVNASALDLILMLTPPEAARVRIGARVELLSSTAADSASFGEAAVVAVGGAVDSATRAVQVRAGLRRTERPVRLGETFDARITLGTRAAALVVPLESLVPDGEAFRVFIVDSAGIAHARAVDVGGRTDKLAEILSGVQRGETVVTYGAYGLDDGVRIAPPAPAAATPGATPRP